jgi:D-beta-D-heptose 7-phosphate kinase/D-beta-D-heptose 1-phosphate adenosyltransferase
MVTRVRMERKFEILDWEGTAEFTENGKVFSDVEKLRIHLGERNKYQDTELKIVAVSGGFDPIHIGHIRYIQAAAKIAGKDGVLVVIANKDSWLRRKKDFAFMGEEERMEILASIKGVDYVIPWDDGTPNVAECLKLLKPHVFANGGDRNSIENVPEYPICQEINCAMIFGVGGGKIQSSSDLVRSSKDATKTISK